MGYESMLGWALRNGVVALRKAGLVGIGAATYPIRCASKTGAEWVGETDVPELSLS